MTNAYQWLGTIKVRAWCTTPWALDRTASIARRYRRHHHSRADRSQSSPELFEVTGSEMLSVPEQVSILAQALGKPIQSVDVPTEAAVQGLLRAGLPAPAAKAVAQSFELIRDGRAAVVKNTVKQVTGKQPRTFQSWAQEHAIRFA